MPYRDKNKEREKKRRHYLKNRESILKREHDRYHNNKDRAVEYQMIHKYGITRKQYDELLERQGGCAICKSPDANRVGHKMHIDHDHGTGRVRGLLCSRCNTSLGLMKEDIEALWRMIQYLNDNRWR